MIKYINVERQYKHNIANGGAEGNVSIARVSKNPT